MPSRWLLNWKGAGIVFSLRERNYMPPPILKPFPFDAAPECFGFRDLDGSSGKH
jgi:hypothetical protein